MFPMCPLLRHSRFSIVLKMPEFFGASALSPFVNPRFPFLPILPTPRVSISPLVHLRRVAPPLGDLLPPFFFFQRGVSPPSFVLIRFRVLSPPGSPGGMSHALKNPCRAYDPAPEPFS